MSNASCFSAASASLPSSAEEEEDEVYNEPSSAEEEEDEVCKEPSSAEEEEDVYQEPIDIHWGRDTSSNATVSTPKATAKAYEIYIDDEEGHGGSDLTTIKKGCDNYSR